MSFRSVGRTWQSLQQWVRPFHIPGLIEMDGLAYDAGFLLQHTTPQIIFNMEKYGFNMDSGIWIQKGCKHAMCPTLRQLEELGRLAQGQ